jgi:hypothetical protein
MTNRFSAAHGKDLYLPPPHASHARAQGLHNRFLTGKAHRKLRQAAPAIQNLSLSVHSIEKTLAVASQDPFHTVDLYDINANGMAQLSSLNTVEC